MTDIEIVNAALARLNVNPIISFVDPSFPYSAEAGASYQQTRDMVLRAGKWACATEFAKLSPIVPWAPLTAYALGTAVTTEGRLYRCTVAGTSASTMPAGTTTVTDGTVTWAYLQALGDNLTNFANRFALPSDFLAKQSVGVGENEDAAKIFSGVIYADDPAPILRYTRRIPEAQFDPMLNDAIINYLAFRLSDRVAGKSRTDLYQEYALVLADAKRCSAIDATERPQHHQLFTEIE
jgi:hypothetical protein